MHSLSIQTAKVRLKYSKGLVGVWPALCFAGVFPGYRADCSRRPASRRSEERPGVPFPRTPITVTVRHAAGGEDGVKRGPIENAEKK